MRTEAESLGILTTLIKFHEMKPFEVYQLYNIEITRGSGTYVFDTEGRRYLDMYGGHAVISVGHTHPHYTEALGKQLGRLGFYSNSVRNSLQEKLSLKLELMSGYDEYSFFMCNSGAEANENAIKLASFHTGRRKIIAFEGAFHGRTSGALAATANESLSSPFNLAGRNCTFIKRWDAETLEKELSSGEYAAVIIEGIQGVAGIIMPPAEFMKELRELCNMTGTLLILDEIQSGCGRTGKFFAHSHAGIKADLVTVAKGLGNGFPIGGVLISPEIKAVKGMLGTTFGGNHLACTAAIAVLEIIGNEDLMQNACRTGSMILDGLIGIGGISNLRGQGLMIGFESEDPDLRSRLLFEKGIFTGAAGKGTIRLLPPLTLSTEDAEYFIASVKSLLD